MKNNRKMKGFTIIELVAVIAIILIMASMIVPKVTSYTSTANNTKYLVDAKVITQAVELYNTEKNENKIDSTTTLIIVKERLMPTAVGTKKYLNSWPGELKIKNAEGYKIAKVGGTETFTYGDLLSFVDSPEN